ncbi:MAG: formylglycine-generating enzyme family protein [Planctomycetes bacterium]|nr:formylglycine-generating enzyme family protein [Planctomycetota bacterium]
MRMVLAVFCVALAVSVAFCQEKGEEGAKSYNDAYVATAGNKEKIPHPLSKKSRKVRAKGKKIDVPEGMVLVPEGEFVMGEGNTEHKVFLDSFCIGKFEVTNAEWKAFVDATNFRPFPVHWRAGAPPEGKENHPDVSWEDAQKYCQWVSEGTGWTVRLPTEAEWEKAASWDSRKRRKTRYPWGDEWDMKQCNKLCNSGYNLAKFGFRPPNDDVFYDMLNKFQKTHKEVWDKICASGGNTTPVGSYKRVRTRYGLYDTAGVVSGLV